MGSLSNKQHGVAQSADAFAERIGESIWRNGGLTGSTAAESFYVKCDDTNNPQSVVDAGQVICEVGVAAAAPMEFLVFQVRQDLTGGTVMES